MLSKVWPIAAPAYRAPRSYVPAEDRRALVAALRGFTRGLDLRIRLSPWIRRPAAPGAAGASR